VQTLQPSLAHSLSLSGLCGTFEHAEYSRVHVERNYCSDDVARVLLVRVREGNASSDVKGLVTFSLSSLNRVQSFDGRFSNRRTTEGKWSGSSSSDNCWGRASWARITTMALSRHGHCRAGVQVSSKNFRDERTPRGVRSTSLGFVSHLAPASCDAMWWHIRRERATDAYVAATRRCSRPWQ